MNELWEILGYDEIVHEIAESLRDSSDICVIEGPPGVGKSWLLNGIGKLWEEMGGSTVVGEGDRLHTDAAYHALGFALARLASRWSGFGSLVLNAMQAGENVAGTGGVIAAAVQAAKHSRPREHQARAMYLGPDEQRILFDLERLADDDPLLLIVDNVHWWDRPSLALLTRLRSTQMCEAFPFLENLRVLAARTPEPYQNVAHRDAVDALLEPMHTRHRRLGRVPRESFGAILRALGMTSAPSADVTDAAYSLTGGHLALAKHCVAQLNDGRGDLFVESVDSSEFLARLLTERIRTLGTLGPDAIELLHVAAVIGLRFRRDAVVCAWHGDVADTSRILRSLRDQEMLELDEHMGSFVHELYREHFLAVPEFDRVEVHERLSDCLRRMSPSDYDARCQNALRCERPTEAATLATQAALARLRQGTPWEDISDEAMKSLDFRDFREIALTMVSAHKATENAEFETAQRLLDSLPPTLPEALCAESDYMRAKCLMRTRSGADRRHAVALLGPWMEYHEREPELGVRLMLQQLYGLVMITDKQPGRELESQIRAVLRGRSGMDKSAEDAQYFLDRCASSLYEPDIAVLKIRDAVRYHRPSPSQTVTRMPIERYKALVNLAAEQVTNALYEDALSTTQEIEELLGRFPDGTLPCRDYVESTALVAEYRLGRTDAQQAAQRQRVVISCHTRDGDRFYPTNNLAVYLALSGEIAAAINSMDGLLEELFARSEPEPSMVYTLRANRCCMRYVAGERDGIGEEWDSLFDIAEQIPYVTRRFELRRHELLSRVIADGSSLTAAQFDVSILGEQEVEFGPMWDQLGRGFRLPSVEWWS